MTFYRLLTMSIGVGLLCACSGDGDNSQLVIEPRPTEVPKINPAQAFSGPLTKFNQAQAKRFIQNGIYSATQQNKIYTLEDIASATQANANYSVTTTQETAVDEADRMEYDGDYLYLASYPQWIEGDEYQSQVRILQRNEDFSLTEIDSLELQSKNNNIDGIYLTQQRLAVVNSSHPIYTISALVTQPWTDFENRVGVEVFDVSSPAQSRQIKSIEIDGWLLSSRRKDNYLYLVTSFTPTVESLIPGATAESELLQNYLNIIDTPVSQLMPQIHIDGLKSAMNAPEDCSFPAKATANDGYGQLLTVTRINLQQSDDIISSCYAVVADMMYMSADNLYLGAGVENQTVFHKVALTDEISYQASGSVEGLIGWSGQPNLRVSEKDGFLRVVSSDYLQREPVHSLTVLQQQGDELMTVASLPNHDHPEPIGKPGEDVFAVRFIEDRAYIVTFERIDPLYVLDLSDNTQPKLAGSLEIPGFSSYLHPLENNYLLGVGQQVDFQDIPDTGTIPVEPPTQTAMKVSLFDVTDPAAPREINAVLELDAYTPVEYDYKALSVLNTNGHYQFAMPMEQWTVAAEDDMMNIWNPINSLLMLEVDTTVSSPGLLAVNKLSVDDPADAYVSGGDDRSVIHGEHVYYIHGNQVWHSLWRNNEDGDVPADGPY